MMVASTLPKAGALGGSAGTATPGSRSSPPRTGSLTTHLKIGARATPAKPTAMKAKRQLT